MLPSTGPLANALLQARLDQHTSQTLSRRIHDDLLAASPYIRTPAFTRIHTRDLEFLFEAYDRHYFTGLTRKALDGCPLGFRLAPRMTMAGGKTTRFRSRTGAVSYEIAIATSMLFEGFGDADRGVTVCGLACASRLEALQRIFEHELVHLAEQICWGESSCAGPRFQTIAANLFGHRSHRHNLITRRERAADSGIRVGALVSFEFEGRRFTGRVNRITKRATVLVEDPGGQRYTDGRHYRSFYVPLASLSLTMQAAAQAAPGADRAERW